MPSTSAHLTPHLLHAQAALAQADPDAALQHIALAATLDIQQHQQAFLAGAQPAAALAGLYSQVFDAIGLTPATLPPRDPRSILLSLPSLVQGQAASHNILRLAEHLALTGWRVGLLVTDEFTRRDPPLAHLDFPDAPSERLGEDLLRRARRVAAVALVPTSGTLLDAIEQAINLARAFRPALFAAVASPACPVHAALFAARVAPTQVNLSIGVPLPIRGVDAVISNNTHRHRLDAPFLESLGITPLHVETSGGDAASGPAITPEPRAALGLPEHAPVLASAGNVLPRRLLATTFAHDLARFLRLHPEAHWLAIGPGDFRPVEDILLAAGVRDRCVFAGRRTDIRPALKAADLLLNEYPEGGGNSVIEAMGAGVPVLAMHAGDRHAECIGALLVGDDALPTPDPAAYWQRAHDWITSRDLRQHAARRQQRRALDRLDYAPINRAYEAHFSSLLRSDVPSVHAA